MVVRRALKRLRPALLGLALAAGTGRAESDALQEARAHLAAGALAEAKTAYKRIGPDSPLWSERVVDALRYDLLQKKPIEAWRLAELLRRMQLQVADYDYYRTLSETQARVCRLGTLDQPWSWVRLLHAHIYRYFSRFQQGNYHADPYSAAGRGPLQHHLGNLQTHLLADIPRAVPLPSTGCRWYSGRLLDRATASDYEFDELRWWFNARQSGQAAQVSRGEEAAALRLLELAELKKDAALGKTILTRYATLTTAEWLLLPEQERRFLWQHLIKAKLIAEPPYAGKSKEGLVVRGIVLGLATPEAAEWLGLLDWKSLLNSEKEALVKHALTIAEIPNRPYLVAISAQAAYRHGDMPAALAAVRRLLLLGEAESDSEAEAFAAALGAQIFSEYRFDEAMLSAVQNALPSGIWGGIFRRQLLLQALTGNSAGFKTLTEAVSSAKQRAARFSPDEQALLEALAGRKPAPFAAVIKNWEEGAKGGAHNTAFLADLGAALLQLKAQERLGVAPYLAQIAHLLKTQIGRGAASDRTLELIRLYSGEAKDRYGAGGETVREGTLQAGVADLRQNAPLTYPYTWNPPTHLPLRDLLMQPKTATSRDWELR